MALSLRELQLLHKVLGPLEDMELITLNPEEREKCCGITRDEKGRCQHRPGHPVFVALPEDE